MWSDSAASITSALRLSLAENFAGSWEPVRVAIDDAYSECEQCKRMGRERNVWARQKSTLTTNFPNFH